MSASPPTGTRREAAAHSHRAVCCSCAEQCGVRVEFDALGQVGRLRGDDAHPFSQGFICPKGTGALDIVRDARRLLKPLRRVGARGEGRWEPVSWDAALDEIASRLGGLVQAHGAESIAYGYGTFRGSDWGIGERFMNLLGSPNAFSQDKVCYGPLVLGEVLTYGFGPTFFAWPTPGTTGCVVLWGMRPRASSPLLWRAIKQAQAAGTKVVVIDPERTAEAERADLWLAPKPGTDMQLALALLKCLFATRSEATGFLDAEAIGAEELRAHLRQLDGDALAEACGVAGETIRRLVGQITDAGPTIFNTGVALCQGGAGSVQLGRAIACLIAATGNLGRLGAHTLAGPPRDISANGRMLRAEALSPAQRAKKLGAERFSFLGRGYGDVDAALAAAWHGQSHILSFLGTAHEPSVWRAILEHEPYAVRGLILQHHNPLGANPDITRIEAALRDPTLELLVVHDLFPSPTARFADFLLPAAHWLEKPYFSTGLGFWGMAGDFVAAAQRALTPPSEVRSDYTLWRDLGQRLGQTGDWPVAEEAFYVDCLRDAGLDFTKLCAAPGSLLGAEARHPAHAEDLPVRRYGTPSGRIELFSSLLIEWGHSPLPIVLAPTDRARAGEYPLTLVTGGRRLEGFHHWLQLSPRFRQRNPDPIAFLHPDTGARWGIVAGQWMIIETTGGRVLQRAAFSDAVAADVVQADRWWYPERGEDKDDPYGVRSTNINACTLDDDVNCDPVLGSWRLRALPCRISKVGE